MAAILLNDSVALTTGWMPQSLCLLSLGLLKGLYSELHYMKVIYMDMVRSFQA